MGRTAVRVCRIGVIAVLVAAALLPACGGSPNQNPAGPTPSSNLPSPTPPTIPAGLSGPLTSMLQTLTAYIVTAARANQDLLPRNPQSTAQLQAKIFMLHNPSLAVDIVNGGRWFEGQATGMNGRVVPILTVFPLESMRAEATAAVRTLEPIVPILEAFFDVPFPTPIVRVWYGFVLGNSGGGGVIYSEDRTTYESRTGPGRLPFDAILGHELGHSYISTEALNQFLEVYAYNVARTGSTDLDAWTFTRGWVPGLATNQDLAAMMDIYQLIGHDAMTRAYRAIYPLRPAYGQPLSPAVIQAFVNQVPQEFQAQVAAKLARVMF